MEAYKFKNGAEMLHVIVDDCIDLYNPETGEYVFLYNDCGSIATYDLEADEAFELAEKAEECDEEYWAGMLGIGGSIYDDPSYEDINPYVPTNLEHCEEVFDGTWYTCDEWYREKRCEYERANSSLHM